MIRSLWLSPPAGCHGLEYKNHRENDGNNRNDYHRDDGLQKGMRPIKTGSIPGSIRGVIFEKPKRPDDHEYRLHFLCDGCEIKRQNKKLRPKWQPMNLRLKLILGRGIHAA
jgi:hypothetical protein